MRMRTIALIGMVLIALVTLGCSKKSEEQAEKASMPPAPASQEATPPPMQGMDSEDSHPADTTTEGMGDGEEESSQGDQAPSDMQ